MSFACRYVVPARAGPGGCDGRRVTREPTYLSEAAVVLLHEEVRCVHVCQPCSERVAETLAALHHQQLRAREHGARVGLTHLAQPPHVLLVALLVRSRDLARAIAVATLATLATRALGFGQLEPVAHDELGAAR
jgi:hypothetical protein